MEPLHTILFATDFSRASLEMAPYAKEMACRFDAVVVVLHAFGLVREYVQGPSLEHECRPGSRPIPYIDTVRDLRRQRQAQLQEFTAAHFSAVRHSTLLEDGEPAEVIESVVRRENADLIVLSTKGLGRFRRLLLGSITAKVLHDIRTPVFTSAHEPKAGPRAGAGFRSILCAVDLALETDAVLRAASFLARTYEADLCLVHMGSASGGYTPRASEERLRESLQNATPEGQKGTVSKAKVRILDRPVAEGIRLVANEERADLVIVGRGHEQGHVSRVWSHLYTIIRDAPCPV